MLEEIDRDEGLYDRLESLGARLQSGLEAVLSETGVPGTFQRVGSMFCLYFTDRGPVRSWADAASGDTERFRRYFHRMLDAGIYLAPSAFEAGFLSAAHTEEDVERTVEAARKALS
jgi:glutamate-1-semialdehyde 2,1-aminomutase